MGRFNNLELLSLTNDQRRVHGSAQFAVRSTQCTSHKYNKHNMAIGIHMI